MSLSWQDINELGLEVLTLGIDKYHDRAYDTVVKLPHVIRRVPSHLRNRPSPGELRRARTMSRNEERYYDTGYESEGGNSRRRTTVAQDSYEPQQYGMREYASQDGYQNDGYAQSYAESRKEQQQYLDYPRQQSNSGGSNDPRSRSYDDLRESERDDRSYYDERDDRRSRRGKSRDRQRSRSRSGGVGSRLGFLQDEDEEGNTELKKWGATLAGAVVGGFAGRTAKKDNWVPTAIGAVVGGLVAREAEKELVKRKHEKHLRKESEYDD